MGGLLSTDKCHSDLKDCKADLEKYKNPMLANAAHRSRHDNPKVGGKRNTQRNKKNIKRTKHRHW